jgi:UDP-N-acetylglucosamine 4,6-dehydratase/5-epimerase
LVGKLGHPHPFSCSSLTKRHSTVIDLNDKVVLITGGTGSFGKKFCQTVLERYTPSKVIVFSRDELKQHDMQFDPAFRDHPAMRYFIGDVRDVDRLEMAFRDVDYVVHAAALKHVSAAEYNPFECIRTNVHGAENVVTAAIRTNVKAVLALSTDKAVSPINLYGASKLASDKIFVAARNLVGSRDLRFGVVRYGNVVGSRGSVVPLFQRLIDQGIEKMPITDARMTRFWITLQHGVDFVLSSMDEMRGGEIFIPKIPSMKIIDLADAMSPGIETEVIGIRPGEKLHEAMITEDDARTTLEFDDRFVVLPEVPKESSYNGGKPVPEDFRYASDNNAEWLNHDQVAALLTDLK